MRTASKSQAVEKARKALQATLAALDDFFEIERSEGFAPRHGEAWVRVTNAYDNGHAVLTMLEGIRGDR